jgi:hypothetical protein
VSTLTYDGDKFCQLLAGCFYFMGPCTAALFCHAHAPPLLLFLLPVFFM